MEYILIHAVKSLQSAIMTAFLMLLFLLEDQEGISQDTRAKIHENNLYGYIIDWTFPF